MTDDLIARLRREAECWTPRGEMETLLLAAAEALAAASRRLGPIDPGGGDRIDELESCIEFLRHEIATLRAAASSSPQEPYPDFTDDVIAEFKKAGAEAFRLPLEASAPPAAPPPWQPISTAPKDADLLLLFADGWGVQAGYWDRMDDDGSKHRWLCVETQGLTGGSMGDGPTHWLALPSPLASEGENRSPDGEGLGLCDPRAIATRNANPIAGSEPADSPQLPSPPASAPQPEEKENEDSQSRGPGERLPEGQDLPRSSQPARQHACCPVCGFDGDETFSPHDYQICGCCGTEFGASDRVLTHAELHQMWVDEGCLWFDPDEPKPEGWDAFCAVLRQPRFFINGSPSYRRASAPAPQEEQP